MPRLTDNLYIWCFHDNFVVISKNIRKNFHKQSFSKKIFSLFNRFYDNPVNLEYQTNSWLMIEGFWVY